jgi:diguanylate cyclase (GGDEF)-like protein
MLRRYLVKHGLFKTVLWLTLAVVAASVIISAAINFFLAGAISTTGVVISIVAPMFISLLITPPVLGLVRSLAAAEAQLRALTITDDLTGISNRRRFIEVIEAEIERSRRYGDTFAIALMDLDNFKEINDTYGHLTGDLVLRAVSRRCIEVIRKSDFCARFGGDEFVILFLRQHEHQAAESAERLREALEHLKIPHEDQALRIQASIGLAVFDSPEMGVNQLLHHADRALYLAKAMGRNRVVIYETERVR